MTLTEYFSRPENPAQASPVAILMMRIIAKDPAVDYEEARIHAQRLLEKAARKNAYRVPRVLGLEERSRLKARMAARTKSEQAERVQALLAFSETHRAAI